jgi:hypothetical protein
VRVQVAAACSLVSSCHAPSLPINHTPLPHNNNQARTLHNGDAVGARHLAGGVAQPGQLLKAAQRVV